MAGLKGDGPPRDTSSGSLLLDALAALCLLCVAYSEITGGIALAARLAAERHMELLGAILEENEQAERAGSILGLP